MKNFTKKAVPSTLLAALLFSFCGLVYAQNIATVNGVGVPKARLDSLISKFREKEPNLPPDIEDKVREALIKQEIIYQAAKKADITDSKEFKLQMDLAARAAARGLLLEDYKAKHPVTEEEINAEYAKLAANVQNKKEYNASHILVATQAEAQKTIQALNKGKPFAALAKKDSKDKGSAQNGGNLGWSMANNYVPEFAQALMQLKKGQTTQAPVKTSFGYHIIRLDDVRDIKLPPLQEIRSQIANKLMVDKLKAYEESLIKAAKVQ
jgi:peptidyl-prolyl cis-trans isomerase C